MEENSDSGFSLESVEFIFRHPWVILFSFLIIFNLFHAIITSMPPKYKATAVLSFEAVPGTRVNEAVINEKKRAAENIVSGLNEAFILSAALKDETAANRAVHYDRLAEKLNDPKAGLLFTWDKKSTSPLLTIDFTYSNAQICRAVVKAAMDTIITESEQKVTRQLQANMAFLNDQQKFYKEQLEGINKEIEAIKGELVTRFPEVTDEEKELIVKSTTDSEIAKKGAVQKLEMQEEVTAKLKTELVELQQKRRRLQDSIDNGTFMAQYSLEEINRQDLISNESSKAVAAKEVEISAMIARGYKEGHPLLKELRQEIDHLKETRRSRIGLLRTAGPGTQEYEEAKEKVMGEIDELGLRIDFIKDGLKAADETKKVTAARLKAESATGSDIKERVSRLMTLKSERDLNEQYYTDMRKKLADAELKARTEKRDLGFKIEIVQEPEVPKRPDSAGTVVIILRLFLVALAASVGVAYLIDMLKQSVRNSRELSEILGVPVLATIDRIATIQDVAAERRQIKLAAVGTAVIMVVSRVLIYFIFLPISGKL